MNGAREAFENWYVVHFVDKFVNIGAQLEKRGDQYVDFHAQDMWEVWQEKQKKIDELTKQRDSFIKAYEIEMDESVELQKRVDAALKETLNALQYVEGDMRGNFDFLQMAMIRTFKELKKTLESSNARSE